MPANLQFRTGGLADRRGEPPYKTGGRERGGAVAAANRGYLLEYLAEKEIEKMEIVALRSLRLRAKSRRAVLFRVGPNSEIFLIVGSRKSG